eukprot:GEMP01067668.1.p1 GENE.GEMP01067668.1~~GEMP01067668.1.p1  ORF type:complete len:280 (+),score=59.72 GEMP01067668.1:96-935(+)
MGTDEIYKGHVYNNVILHNAEGLNVRTLQKIHIMNEEGEIEEVPKKTMVELIDLSTGNTDVTIDANGIKGIVDIVDDHGNCNFGSPTNDVTKWFGGRRARKFILASQRDDIDKVKRMLEKAVPLYVFWVPSFNVNATDSLGMTACMHACFAGSFDVMEALLADARTDISRCDYFSRTPLHYLAMSTSKMELRVVFAVNLIRSGVDCSVKDQKGKTAEDYAMMVGRKMLSINTMKFINVLRGVKNTSRMWFGFDAEEQANRKLNTNNPKSPPDDMSKGQA